MVRTADPTCMKQCVPSRSTISSDSIPTRHAERGGFSWASRCWYSRWVSAIYRPASASATRAICKPPVPRWELRIHPDTSGCAAVGWVWCKLLFFVEPAYAVSLGCLACMVLAVALLMDALRRYGLHVAAAGALGLMLLSYKYAWASLTVPEVYAPVPGGDCGRVRAGVALWAKSSVARPATRGCSARLHRRQSASDGANAAGIRVGLVDDRVAPACTADAPAATGSANVGLCHLPLIGTVVLVLARDVPGNRYNYLEHYNELHGELPAQGEGAAARWERAWWLLSSAQYQEHLSKTMGQVRTQARYVRRELHLYESERFWPVVVVLALGVGVLARRAPEGCVACGGSPGRECGFPAALPTTRADGRLAATALGGTVPDRGGPLRVTSTGGTPLAEVAPIPTLAHLADAASDVRLDNLLRRHALQLCGPGGRVRVPAGVSIGAIADRGLGAGRLERISPALASTGGTRCAARRADRLRAWACGGTTAGFVAPAAGVRHRGAASSARMDEHCGSGTLSTIHAGGGTMTSGTAVAEDRVRTVLR